MIYELSNTNLLGWLDEQTTPSGIIQQCNCFHTQNGGIARQISTKWPQVLAVDKKNTVYGDRTKLGQFTYVDVGKTFDVAKAKRENPEASVNDLIAKSKKESLPKIVYNLYSQFTFGNGRQTLYDPMVEGLEKIRIHAISKGLTRLGLPCNMGCTLGGGDWNIVRAIIGSVFHDDEELDLYICKYG